MAKASCGIPISEEKWRIESDLRTLCEAREIEKDSKRMAAVRKLAQEKLLTLAGVAGDEDAD